MLEKSLIKMLSDLTDDELLGRLIEWVQLLFWKYCFGIDIVIKKGQIILAE